MRARETNSAALDGDDLRREPLERRKVLLAKLSSPVSRGRIATSVAAEGIERAAA